ncbi:hypothetical protein ACPOL_6423 [Acidisarcina polymorpha]|uniref:Uncharacterized protein n=2 Tax=Acidobacteriaceae TaxID=204434 RepID=A0A4V1L4Y8_9BACT|nr:hypothetical protein ACPOL_6423 [Acidisarcina polymorpha]RXH53914.1 hypothetical protein GRAN_5252 [Granulicella sibirica]
MPETEMKPDACMLDAAVVAPPTGLQPNSATRVAERVTAANTRLDVSFIACQLSAPGAGLKNMMLLKRDV